MSFKGPPITVWFGVFVLAMESGDRY